MSELLGVDSIQEIEHLYQVRFPKFTYVLIRGHNNLGQKSCFIFVFMRSLLAFLFVLLIKECFSNFQMLLRDSVGVPFECTSSYYHYTIEVTYKSLASSQAIEVFQWRNHSVAWVTSLYGYGKDNLIETTNICLKGSFYQFICSSRYYVFLIW